MHRWRMMWPLLFATSRVHAAGTAGYVAGITDQATSLAQLATSVQQATPAPCFSLMLAFKEPLAGVPFDSASFEPGLGGSSNSGSSHAFQWVANNSSKPGRPQDGAPQCWVAVTTAQRAQQLLERQPVAQDGRFVPQTRQYQAEVAQELLADFRALMQSFVQASTLWVLLRLAVAAKQSRSVDDVV
jgi:hypothetical protein